MATPNSLTSTISPVNEVEPALLAVGIPDLEVSQQVAIGPSSVPAPNTDVAVEALLQDIRGSEAAEVVAAGYEEAALFISPPFSQLLKELEQARTAHTESSPSKLEIADKIETQGYVKEAPRFQEQVKDVSRTKSFTFLKKRFGEAPVDENMTEAEGLSELHAYLTTYMETATSNIKSGTVDPSTEELVEQAKSMLEDLTFIGAPELQEAVTGLADYWRAYLNADPSRKICILTEVGKLPRYQEAGLRKSDEYIKKLVWAQFSEEELEQYEGRIVDDIHEVRTDPENVKVIILDDWVISGSQLRNVYKTLHNDPTFQYYADNGSVEINMVVASEGRINNGLSIPLDGGSQDVIRVKSYYSSHHAHGSVKEHNAHVTGLHSAADYDFKVPIRRMVKSLKKQGVRLPQPALSMITRDYYPENRPRKILGRTGRAGSQTTILENPAKEAI